MIIDPLHCFYAPIFEEVEEAYCFLVVGPSLHKSIHHTYYISGTVHGRVPKFHILQTPIFGGYYILANIMKEKSTFEHIHSTIISNPKHTYKLKKKIPNKQQAEETE